MARKKANQEHMMDHYTSSLPASMRRGMEMGSGPDMAEMPAGCRSAIHAGGPGKKPKVARKKG